jgi:O-antigen ligase
LATWIETPIAFLKGNNRISRAPAKFLPTWGLLLGLLVYELVLGAVASCLHPLISLFLAAGPFLLLGIVAKPLWAYGLFIISIQFSDLSFAQFGTFQFRAVDAGFFFLLAIFTVTALTEKKVLMPKTDIDVSLWILLGWIILSFTWSLNQKTGLEALIKIFIGVLTFYITVYLISGRSQLNAALNVWILAGVVSALAAIHEFRAVAVHQIMPGMEKWATPIRSQGFFGGPIMLGSFLTLSICINYGLILRTTRLFKRILLLTTCGMMLAGLLTTLSRNDIAAWMLVTAFFNYRFKKMRLPTASVLLVIVILAFLVTGTELFTVFWNRFFYVFEGLEVSSPARVNVWRLALETIGKHPILGSGVGGFTQIVEVEALGRGLIYPHSLILYVLLDTGMIGLVLVSHLAVRIFRFVRVAEKGISGDADKAVAAAMTAGLLVHMFWSLAQNITFQHIILWAFLGISFATYRVLSTSEPGRAPKRDLRKREDG